MTSAFGSPTVLCKAGSWRLMFDSDTASASAIVMVADAGPRDRFGRIGPDAAESDDQYAGVSQSFDAVAFPATVPCVASILS